MIRDNGREPDGLVRIKYLTSATRFSECDAIVQRHYDSPTWLLTLSLGHPALQVGSHVDKASLGRGGWRTKDGGMYAWGRGLETR